MLEQDVSGTFHHIAYASRTLSKQEANYGATELEELGVMWSLRHFRAYLLGHKCIVINARLEVCVVSVNTSLWLVSDSMIAFS